MLTYIQHKAQSYTANEGFVSVAEGASMTDIHGRKITPATTEAGDTLKKKLVVPGVSCLSVGDGHCCARVPWARCVNSRMINRGRRGELTV
jgi:hypothetical protein